MAPGVLSRRIMGWRGGVETEGQWDALERVTRLRAGAVAAKTCWRTTETAATFPEAVRENEEVVPVNEISTWVLPSGVTVGR